MPWVYPSDLIRGIVFLGKQPDIGIPPTIMDHARKAGLAFYFRELGNNDTF